MLQRSQESGDVYFPMSPIKPSSKACHIHMYVNTFPKAWLPRHPRTDQIFTLGTFSRIIIAGSRILVTARLPVRPPSQLSWTLATSPDSSPPPRLDPRLLPPGEHSEDFPATTSRVKTMVKTLVNLGQIFKGLQN